MVLCHDFWSNDTYHSFDTIVGPVYSLRVLWTHLLVVNGAHEARELLEGRSGMYSGRPIPSMVKL